MVSRKPAAANFTYQEPELLAHGRGCLCCCHFAVDLDAMEHEISTSRKRKHTPNATKLVVR